MFLSKKSAGSSLIEEGLYSGILLTQNNTWIIPRFAVALLTGMTAARGLLKRVEPNSTTGGFTTDTKIGFVWALARESLLWSLPVYYSIPLLCAADSAVFALSEVCSSKGNEKPTIFSKPWAYKVLSSAFFRATANTAALAHGITSSITQHLLFNVSRGLD